MGIRSVSIRILNPAGYLYQMERRYCWQKAVADIRGNQGCLTLEYTKNVHFCKNLNVTISINKKTYQFQNLKIHLEKSSINHSVCMSHLFTWAIRSLISVTCKEFNILWKIFKPFWFLVNSVPYFWHFIQCEISVWKISSVNMFLKETNSWVRTRHIGILIGSDPDPIFYIVLDPVSSRK